MLNLFDSAYIFDARRKENPAETCFLHDDGFEVHKMLKKGIVPEFDGVLWGAFFEEARKVGTITIRLSEHVEEFSNRLALQYAVPGIEWNNSKCYTWYQSHFEDHPSYPRQLDDRTYVYPAAGLYTCGIRLYVHKCNFPLKPGDIPPFEIIAEGPETEPIVLKVESGLWGKPAGVRTAETYNGYTDARPEGDALALTVEATPGITGPDRTVVTLSTGCGDVSFLPAECRQKGYMAIPDFGLLISCGEVPDSIRKNPYTAPRIRERVKGKPWRTFEAVSKDIGLKKVSGVAGKTDKFDHHEPKSYLITPDKRMNDHWNIGLSHLMSFCTELENGRWDVKIGPYPMFGTESAEIVKMLGLYGRSDVSKGAIDVFLDSASKWKPEGLYQTKEGCLNIPYGIYKTDCWVPYEPSFILMSITEYYLFSRDLSFLRSAKDKLIACIEWIFREIDLWKIPGVQDAGLLPPTRNGDISDWGTCLEGDGDTYMAIRCTLAALKDVGDDRLEALEKRLAEYKQDIRAAYRYLVSRVPVTPLRDGTYSPSFAVKTYLRGWMSDIWPFSPVNALRGAWLDVDHSLQIFDAGVFDPDEREMQWVLDTFEDNLALNDYLLPKKWDDIRQDPETGARDATAQKTDYDAEKDWYEWGGTGWQNGYCPLMQVYLRTGEAKAYIRSFYNTYALHADPDNFWLREHAASLRYAAKTFEEAWMLFRLRAVLVWDTPDTLYLCRCTPDEWYEKGFEVKNMPTYFGTLNMKCEGGRLTVHMDFTVKPEQILLRLPEGKTVSPDLTQNSWTFDL